MNDEILNKTITIEKYESVPVNDSLKIKLTTNDGEYSFFKNKRDGNQTKAYSDFVSLGGLPATVEVGYKIQVNGQYENKTILNIKKATQAPNSTPKTENTNVPTQTSTAPQIAQISTNTEAHELSLGMLKILQSQNATIIKLLVELKDIVSRETLEEQDEELVAFIDEKFGVAK